MSRSVDFPHAYKTIAPHPGSADSAYIFFTNPFNNRPYKSRILVHPFGSRMAPANWRRVVTFIHFVALKLRYIAVDAFVDDVCCAVNITISKSGFWALRQLCLLIGFNTSGRKGQAPSSDLSLLGEDVPSCETLFDRKLVDNGYLSWGATLLMRYISTAIRLPPRKKCAAALASPTLLMGKLGRGTMGPLIARQYHSRATNLRRALKRSLPWRYNAFGSLPRRATPFLPHPPFGDHSDAQDFGRIGCRVILDRSTPPTPAFLFGFPAWRRGRKVRQLFTCSESAPPSLPLV